MQLTCFRRMHSLLRFRSECKRKILQVSIPSIRKSGNGFCRIRPFPFQPAKNSGMVFGQTIFFHPRPPKFREWLSPKQSFPNLRVECRPSVIVGVGWPTGRGRRRSGHRATKSGAGPKGRAPRVCGEIYCSFRRTVFRLVSSEKVLTL